ncbi:hypothetical protein Tco_1105076 [Tanacetum coccineum]
MVIESEKRNSHLQKNHIDLQLKFQNYKQCIDTSSASNAIFEINKLRKQLQGKDDTIRNLETQINITRMLNVGSTKGSCDQQAFETDRIQLKDTITSLRIQLDGLKLSALTAGKFQAEAQVTGKTSSGPSTSEKPKVLASGIYNLGFSGIRGTSLSRAGKPVKKVLLMNLSDHRIKPGSKFSTIARVIFQKQVQYPIKKDEFERVNISSVEAEDKSNLKTLL